MDEIVIVVQPWVHFVPLARHLSHTASFLEGEDVLPFKHPHSGCVNYLREAADTSSCTM